MFSMNACRFFLIPISLLLVFAACKQDAVKKIAKVSIDSEAYLPPVPGNIPKEEFDGYFNAVQDYYVHNLVDKGFNGGILVAKKGM